MKFRRVREYATNVFAFFEEIVWRQHTVADG